MHFTRIVPPPPLPEPLHWSIVALVVLPIGSHERSVGSAARAGSVALVDGGRRGRGRRR